MNPTVLANQTHEFVRSQEWQAAVLPFGATEPHNFHMPYGTDCFQVSAIAEAACGYAWERGAKVLCLPTIPFGVNTNHFGVPGGKAISLTPSTLMHVLADVVDSLERHGIRKLVLLNGHGGNELKPMIREVFHRTKVFVCLCDWFRLAPDVTRTLLEHPGDHADELESSMGLHLFPERMKMEQAADGKERVCRFEAVRRGWVTIVRPWHLLNDSTGTGDPRAATAEKGAKLMGIFTERLGGFLTDLAGSPMDELFPMQP